MKPASNQKEISFIPEFDAAMRKLIHVPKGKPSPEKTKPKTKKHEK